ncbi:MAG: methyltransferase domain-containing protein, partial [Clostridia bacterium]|nr:methyltransferase domain-containing protein [Clostridia bacterium]
MKSTDIIMNEELETLENLGNGYRILQRRDAFRFGTDAVKLADFTNVKPGDAIMDLCTGTGIVPILLHNRASSLSVTGLELQEQIAEMAERSVKLNGLTDSIKIVQGDVREVRKNFAAESFHVVTCNPPYMKNETGKQNLTESVSIARHEICCNLEDC